MPIPHSKVAIIGSGNVGSTFAFALMISGLAREIVLIGRDRKKAEGECMDLNHIFMDAHLWIIDHATSIRTQGGGSSHS